ncbi:MAG: hypothetical protein IAA73_01260 [Bacteroidetes bacterium]|uniref:Uncharacterized protein n=1 Tax=Candidatus Gallipaludibacter merdavium TaxID=2840839 RepID=A0A9D9HRH9_9BACT|nr:hypothetical protein [Candidatus Gallipaludibacter merdavium]
MNFNFYLIGTPSGRYSQYPNDYTVPIFTELQKGLQGGQLVIHREMNLVHYAFFECLDENQMIGFGLIFNNARLQKPCELINLFRFIVEKKLVDSGTIYQYAKDGKLTFQVKMMNECLHEYNRLKDFINLELEQNASKYGIEPLRTVYNGIKTIETIDDNVTDAQIINLTNQHNTVIVKERSGIEHGYIPKLIASLREQYQTAIQKNEKLQDDLAKLNRAKKQYRWVAFLSITIVFCLIGIYFLNDNLSGIINNQSSNIKKLQITLQEQKKDYTHVCDSLGNEIDDLESDLKKQKHNLNLTRDSLNSITKSLGEAQNVLSELKNDFPIQISRIEIGNTYQGGDIETDYGNAIYSSRTMFLQPRITYRGINTSKYVKLKTRWYDPDGKIRRGKNSPKGFSQEKTIFVHEGYNTITLLGWGNKNKGHWGKGNYRLEIWYEDICLKAKSFTVY